MGSRALAAAGPTRTRSPGLWTLHSHARRPSCPQQHAQHNRPWRAGARAGGATDSDAVGGPGAAAAGKSPTGRRAESDGAGAVAGWLAGLGLGTYAEALLGAGWDCAEVGAARALPPRAAARRSVSRKAAIGRRRCPPPVAPSVRGSSCPLSAVEGRPRPGPGRGGALPPSRHPPPLPLKPAAVSSRVPLRPGVWPAAPPRRLSLPRGPADGAGSAAPRRRWRSCGRRTCCVRGAARARRHVVARAPSLLFAAAAAAGDAPPHLRDRCRCGGSPRPEPGRDRRRDAPGLRPRGGPLGPRSSP